MVQHLRGNVFTFFGLQSSFLEIYPFKAQVTVSGGFASGMNDDRTLIKRNCLKKREYIQIRLIAECFYCPAYERSLLSPLTIWWKPESLNTLMKWRNMPHAFATSIKCLKRGEPGHDKPVALLYCSFVSSIASDAFFQLSKSLSSASIIGFGPRIST